MRSNNELVKELRTAPGRWMDAAIVVAFENRFEFVSEDHPDPLGRLNALQRQRGLAIGLAAVVPTAYTHPLFFSQVFQEYKGQSWAHRYMDILHAIVPRQSSTQSVSSTRPNPRS